jgi:predicted PurR-regulated permease PerM
MIDYQEIILLAVAITLFLMAIGFFMFNYFIQKLRYELRQQNDELKDFIFKELEALGEFKEIISINQKGSAEEIRFLQRISKKIDSLTELSNEKD